MKSLPYYWAIALGLFFLIGCKEDPNKPEDPIQIKLAEIKAEYAPDKRVALFDVTAIQSTDKYVLKGESNLPEAIAALKTRLAADSIPFIDSIQLLPADNLGKKIKGIINISVANLRTNPSHSSEMSTQALLGTIVKVYKKQDDWYFVQTPDNYLAWVDAGGMVLADQQKADNWNTDDKIMYTQTYGHAYSDPVNDTAIVSDLTAGDLLTTLNYDYNNYVVRFPDGRNAYVRTNEAKPYDVWLKNLSPTPETLVSEGKKLMGVPYLWGGTSTKGMDCSGFTKTIYFLNGMVLPRDASQQVRAGRLVDSTANFDNLEKGDLLFFGRKATDSTAEKVVHVGMWIGNNEYIHSSGRVQINSMDRGAANFDEYNYNRYLRTNRYLNEMEKGFINLAETTLLKN